MDHNENLSFEEMMEQAFSDDGQYEEVVENSSETETDSAEASAEGASVAEDTEGDSLGSTAERNGRQAYGRRVREANERFEKYNREVDDFFKAQGYEGFADAKEKQAKAALEKEIGNLGFNAKDITPAIEAVVNNMPTMQAARQIAEQAENQRQEMEFNKQLELISKMDPSIQTVEDLLAMENRERFDYFALEKGLSLSEAFKLANFDKLSAAKAEAASRKTFNSVVGKQHLNRTSVAGTDAISVPDETASMYRALNPDATDEEIRKHYAKSLK